MLLASFIQRARSYEAKFGVIPTFAASARDVRSRLRRVERGFRARYRAALESWRGGRRDVVFPMGTWQKVGANPLVPAEDFVDLRVVA